MWYSIQALEKRVPKGAGRKGRPAGEVGANRKRGRENLENDTERLRENDS